MSELLSEWLMADWRSNNFSAALDTFSLSLMHQIQLINSLIELLALVISRAHILTIIHSLILTRQISIL